MRLKYRSTVITILLEIIDRGQLLRERSKVRAICIDTRKHARCSKPAYCTGFSSLVLPSKYCSQKYLLVNKLTSFQWHQFHPVSIETDESFSLKHRPTSISTLKKCFQILHALKYEKEHIRKREIISLPNITVQLLILSACIIETFQLLNL